MTGKRCWLKIASFIPVLILVLYGDWIKSTVLIGGLIRDLALTTGEEQWLAILTALFYLVAFSAISIWSEASARERRKEKKVVGLLFVFLGALLFRYVKDYKTACESTDTLVLIAAITVGKMGAILWRSLLPEKSNCHFRLWFVLAWCVLLSFMCFTSSGGAVFRYRGYQRWTGIWSSPNLFGMLMAVGVLLSIGGLRLLKPRRELANREIWDGRKTTWWLLTFGATGLVTLVGLVCSYSRGAWIGAVLAGIFICLKIEPPHACGAMSISDSIFKARRAIIICLVSVLLLATYYSQHSDSSIVRRVSSSANLNDFSWRNRVRTYESAFQMVGDHPKFGMAGDDVVRTYSGFYAKMKANVTDGGVIKENDYLSLAITFGVLPLLLILSYIWIRLSRLLSAREDPLAINFAAIAIALLTGFWFDGGGWGAGLFVMATSTHFWLMLELGHSSTLRSTSPEPEPTQTGRERCFELRVSPWIALIKPHLRFASRVGSIAIFWVFVLTVLEVALASVLAPPATVPMLVRLHTLSRASYSWIPLPTGSTKFMECAWISEDNRFFEHHGFDWIEVRKAWEESQRTGIPARGASTITQQCARSVFLWQGRSWVRKGLEGYYTALMELMLPKKRILELYVNAIEFGDGIYGLEAAAQHYYHKHAKDLTREEAAMLVAIMPKPREWDPLHPNERVLKRQKVILDRSANVALPIRIGNEGEHSGEAEGNQKQ